MLIILSIAKALDELKSFSIHLWRVELKYPLEHSTQVFELSLKYGKGGLQAMHFT